jgi:hypothetical protein
LRVSPICLVLALFTTGTGVYPISLGFGVNYFVGVPVDGPAGEGTIDWFGDTFSVKVTDGPDFKPCPVSFAAGAVVKVVPPLDIEGGIETHVGYKNKKAAVFGRVYHDGNDEPLKETIEEDSVKTRLTVLNCGTRFNLPFKGRVKPFASAGFLFSFTKLEGLGLEGEIEEVYTAGNNLGVYVGGGLNFFVSDNFALSFPVKYRLFFGSPHTLHVKWFGTEEVFDADIKPAPVLSFGGGVEYYPF